MLWINLKLGKALDLGGGGREATAQNSKVLEPLQASISSSATRKSPTIFTKSDSSSNTASLLL